MTIELVYMIIASPKISLFVQTFKICRNIRNCIGDNKDGPDANRKLEALASIFKNYLHLETDCDIVDALRWLILVLKHL